MGLQLQVVNKQACFKPPAFCYLSPVKGLTRLHLLHHHPSIQLLHQSRTITLTLDKPTSGGTVSTRTPTATRWRRSSSRTSASLTKRGLAIPRTRRSASP